MFFKRSTRAIVTGRRRKKDIVSDGTDATENSAPEIGEQETRTIDMKNKDLMKSIPFPVWGGRVTVSIAAAVLILALILLFCLPKNQGDILEIPDNKTVIAAVSEKILADQIISGDIVRLYDQNGQVIPELQYVEVLGKNNNGELLLLMSEAQTTAFVCRHSGTVSLVLQQDPEKATSLLDLQQRIISPDITLTLAHSLSAAPGDSIPLELGIAMVPEEAIFPGIVWTSSNPEVATVEDGTVSVHQIGETLITASCGPVSASCHVTAQVPLDNITLNHTEAKLEVGSTLVLTAAPEPSDATDFAVTWTVDDPAVASVAEDGTVTALSPGTVTVTASCGETSVSCSILVGIQAELIQLSQHTLEIPVNQTAELTYNVYPANSILNSPVFSSSDEAIATVSQDGTITAVGIGTATITVTCGEVSDSCVITVSRATATTESP